MAMKTCMNISCGTTSSAEWKTGWSLRSGELAILCDKCGYAYEQRIYCEEFHSDDSGWRECVTCGKRVHCGCIASLSLIELLDVGGVKCIGCARNPVPNSIWNEVVSKNHGLGSVTENTEGVGNHKDKNGSNQLSMLHDPNTNATSGMLKKDGIIFPDAEAVVTAQPPPPPPPVPPRTDPLVIGGSWTAGAPWTSVGSFLKDRRDDPSNIMQTKNDYESVAKPNLNISLCTPGKYHFTSGIVIKEKEPRKMSNAFDQGFLSPSVLPTLPKLPLSPAPNSNMSMMPQSRVAKSPFEGRGRNQLLPRYWPRITEQELQQIAGDPNCTITPLFEKVLSASDAGKIGRLVLPKACAEAYFPPISQAEGLPIKIQDIKGKEWVFQFRFWPNNNSRMYVLEGVTPCIQSMQLQAGDTVTFSRKDPEGKLIMGFRKASPSMQDVPATNGSSGLPQSLKGSTDTHMNILSRQLDSACNVNLVNGEKFGEPTEGGLLPTSVMMTEKKKGRNIGAKGKRLLIDNQDVQALRLTWEEVQGMLRPSPNAKPNIVEIDGFEIEEYDEPPVIGKTSVFGAHSSGVIDQWAQCDSCSKWRKLPADYLIPPKWTCADNAWDTARCSCSAPDGLSSGELEKFSNLSKDSKKKRMAISDRVIQEQESSGLSALANAAGLGDDPDEAGTSTTATTTRHPRHRPGCSCIVCIQPPSGKGKHDSNCTCTVCMTVKRRFKTLMMRKKKRQSDLEAGTVLKTRRKKKSKGEDDKPEVENAETNIEMDSLLTELTEIDDSSVMDLNNNPEREENENSRNGLTDLTSLLQFVKNNGLTFWTPEEQASHMAPVIEGQRAEELPVNQAVHGEQVNSSDGSFEPQNCDKYPQ